MHFMCLYHHQNKLNVIRNLSWKFVSKSYPLYFFIYHFYSLTPKFLLASTLLTHKLYGSKLIVKILHHIINFFFTEWVAEKDVGWCIPELAEVSPNVRAY